MFVYILNLSRRVIWLCFVEDLELFAAESHEYVQSLIFDKTLCLN